MHGSVRLSLLWIFLSKHLGIVLRGEPHFLLLLFPKEN